VLLLSIAHSAPPDTVRVRFIIDDTTSLSDDTILGNYIEDSLTNSAVEYIVDYRDETDNPFETDSFNLVIVSYGNGNITSAEHIWLLDSVVNVLSYNRHSSSGLKLGNGNVLATNFRTMARLDTSWVNKNRNCGWDSVIVFSQVAFVWELTLAGSGSVQKLYLRDSSTFNSSTFQRDNNDTALIVSIDSNLTLDDGSTLSKGRYLYDGTIANGNCAQCDELGAGQALRFLNEVLWCVGDTLHRFNRKKVFEGYNLTHYWAEWGFTGRHEAYGNSPTGGVAMRLGFDGNIPDTSYFKGFGYWFLHGTETVLAGLQVDSSWLKMPVAQFFQNSDNNYGYQFDVDLFLLEHSASPFKIFDLNQDPMNTAAQADSTLVTDSLSITRYAFKGYDTLWSGGGVKQSLPLAGTDYNATLFATQFLDSTTYGHFELSTTTDTVYKDEVVFVMPNVTIEDWKTTNNGFFSLTDSQDVDVTTCDCDMELVMSASSDVSGTFPSRGRESADNAKTLSEDFATRIIVWTQDSVTVTDSGSRVKVKK